MLKPTNKRNLLIDIFPKIFIKCIVFLLVLSKVPLVSFASSTLKNNPDKNTKQKKINTTYISVTPMYGLINNVVFLKQPKTYTLDDTSGIFGLFGVLYNKKFSIVNFFYYSEVNSAKTIGDLINFDYYLPITRVLQWDFGVGANYTGIFASYLREDYDNLVSPLKKMKITNNVFAPFAKVGVKYKFGFRNMWYFNPYIGYLHEHLWFKLKSYPALIDIDKEKGVNSLLLGFNFKVQIWYVSHIKIKFYSKTIYADPDEPSVKYFSKYFVVRLQPSIYASRNFGISGFIELTKSKTYENFYWVLGPTAVLMF